MNWANLNVFHVQRYYYLLLLLVFSPTVFAEVISPVRNHYFSRRNNNPVPKGDLRFWPLKRSWKTQKAEREKYALHMSSTCLTAIFLPPSSRLMTIVVTRTLFYFRCGILFFFQLLMVCEDMELGYTIISVMKNY